MALQATSTVWPPPYYTPNETVVAAAAIAGLQPARHVRGPDGIDYINMACECSTDGEYVGAVPCNDNMLMIASTVLPITVNEYCKGENVVLALGTAIQVTITPSGNTATPAIATPTYTPIPQTSDQCVLVVWDKGLNMRYGPSMGGSPSSYLDEGFVFVPLDVVDGYDLFGNYIGVAAKVAQPNWYIFMNLTYRPHDVYALFVECP